MVRSRLQQRRGGLLRVPRQERMGGIVEVTPEARKDIEEIRVRQINVLKKAACRIITRRQTKNNEHLLFDDIDNCMATDVRYDMDALKRVCFTYCPLCSLYLNSKMKKICSGSVTQKIRSLQLHVFQFTEGEPRERPTSRLVPQRSKFVAHNDVHC